MHQRKLWVCVGDSDREAKSRMNSGTACRSERFHQGPLEFLCFPLLIRDLSGAWWNFESSSINEVKREKPPQLFRWTPESHCILQVPGEQECRISGELVTSCFISATWISPEQNKTVVYIRQPAYPYTPIPTTYAADFCRLLTAKKFNIRFRCWQQNRS